LVLIIIRVGDIINLKDRTLIAAQGYIAAANLLMLLENIEEETARIV
jgi:hypothetical protein